MAKFDITKWREVNVNEKFQAPQGALRVMCSQPATLYFEAFGVEAIAGHGQTIEVTYSEAIVARVEGPKGTRVFIEDETHQFHESESEVFTNIDRTPLESGNVLEVQRAMREFQIQTNQMRQQMRAEHYELLRERKEAMKKTKKPDEILTEDPPQEENETPQEPPTDPKPEKETPAK